MEWIQEAVTGNETWILVTLVGLFVSKVLFGTAKGIWGFVGSRIARKVESTFVVATPTHGGLRVVSAWMNPLKRLRKELNKQFGGGVVVKLNRSEDNFPVLEVVFDPKTASAVIDALHASRIPVWDGSPAEGATPVSAGAHKQANGNVFGLRKA